MQEVSPVSALMVAVSVIVGVSIMVGSFRGTVVSWLDQTLQADIYVSPPTTTASRVIGKLQSVPPPHPAPHSSENRYKFV